MAIMHPAGYNLAGVRNELPESVPAEAGSSNLFHCWECSRHYEAALVGSVALMNTPTISLDMPLRDGVHCVQYSPEPGGLRQAARRALADKSRLRALARAACEHVCERRVER